MKISRFQTLKRVGWSRSPLSSFGRKIGGVVHTILPFLAAVWIAGCATPKEIIKTEVIYRDSLVYKTDTFKVERIERVKDYTGLLDTLRLETSQAEATAYVDTTMSALRGELKNKPIKVPVQIKEHYVLRDSIRTVEVPVEVEKIVEKRYTPFLVKVFAILGLISILYFGIKLFLFFKK